MRSKRFSPSSTLKAILLLQLFTIVIASRMDAQYFSLGQEPASIRWKQIRTENFRVIFPGYFSEQAQYVANVMEYVRGPVSLSMGVEPKPFPVILHTNTTYSNAFVPYAPKRIEINVVPPQWSDPQRWIDQLALHEYRHAVQYTRVRAGFTKVLSCIFGEQAVPAVYGVFVPFWFIEGDATIAETALSTSGRGRQPSFEMRIKAQFLDQGVYNYDKALHGSYRDFTPDVYELGYHLMSQAAARYPGNMWANVIGRVGRKPYTLVPFSHGIYKETGNGKVKFYKEVTGQLRRGWEEKNERLDITEYITPTDDGKLYTNYLDAVFLNDSVIVVLKEPYNGIPGLYTVNLSTGKQKRITVPGVGTLTETLSIAGSTLLWSERDPDPRWDQRNYAVIRHYDVRSGASGFYTERSKYFAPSFSPDGKLIAAVNVTERDEYFLTVVDAGTGAVLRSYSFPGNPMVQTPSWSENSKEVVAVLVGGSGKALAKYYFQNDSHKILIPEGTDDLSYPGFHGKYILYSASYTGIDNVHALDTLTGEIWQVTSAEYGAYAPAVSPDGKRLLFLNYTSRGHKPAIATLNPEEWTPRKHKREFSLNLYDNLDEGDGFIFNQDDVPDSTYFVTPYKKGRNLFNFHSWGPLSINADNQEVKPGVQVVSQNLLSSSFTSLGWEYDLNEETGKFYLNYRYEGFYPVIDFQADYGPRKAIATFQDGEQVRVKWNEMNLGTTTYIPFNFTKKRYFRSFVPSFEISYIHRDLVEGSQVRLRYNNLVSFTYRFFYSQQTRMNHRDLFPRFGQYIDLIFRHDPFNTSNGEEAGYVGAVVGGIFLPGIVKNHGMRLYLAWQERNTPGFFYSNLISLPRGMTDIPVSPSMFSAKFDYVFPIFYPDWRIGPVMYLKRFKSRLFADYLYWELKDYFPDSYPDGTMEHDYSFGIDITADFHLFSLLAPFEMGARLVEALGPADNQSFSVQFLFSFNIGSIY